MPESSNDSHSSSDTAWTVIPAITGVVTAILVLPLAKALLAVGVVGLGWALFVRTRPLRLRWWPYLLGLSAMLTLAGGTWLIMSGLDGSSASPMPAPPHSGSGAVPLAMKRSGSVTVELPPRNEVPRCWKFQGDARLRPGLTLAIGARRIDPSDRMTYFETAQWTGAAGQSTWWVPRWFGTVPHQIYRVFVMAITRKGLRDVLAAHGRNKVSWDHSEFPPGKVAEVVQLADVRQIPGEGNC